MQIKELYKKFLKAKGSSIKYRNLAAGKKIDVSKKGLWDKKKKQVIVPSNRITMKGPNGEQDFFKKPVVATGLQSGQQVMMQPGGEYYFPNDRAVHEVRMQNGGKKDEESSLENFVEFFDPTGLLSWGDANRAYTQWQKSNSTLPSMDQALDMFGAVPGLGKLGKLKYLDPDAMKVAYKNIPWQKIVNAIDYAGDEASKVKSPVRQQYGGQVDQYQEGGTIQTDITTPIRQKPSAAQDAFNAMLDEYEASKEVPEEDASAPEDMGFQSGGELPVVIDSLFSNFRSGIGKKYAQNGMAVPGVNGTVVANTNAPTDPEQLQMQKGGLGNFKEAPQKSLLPSWLTVRSDTPYQLNDLSPNSKIVGNLNDYGVGDVSEDKNALFNNSSIKLSTQKQLKKGMGKLDINTTVTPFEDKKFTSPNITYSNSIGNDKRSADIRVTPENQSLSLSNNSLIAGNVNLNKNITSNGPINSLDADLQIPRTGATIGRSVTTRPGQKPMSEEFRVGYSGDKVNLKAYSRRDGTEQTYGGNLNTNLGPVNLSGSVSYNPKGMEDYNVAANVDLLKPTRVNPNRGTLNLSGNYGASKDMSGKMNPNYRIGLNYTNSFEEGGEVEDDDDKEMVEGVASILRRVKDPKNRLQLARQLSQQFNREGVEYSRPSFLAKSNVPTFKSGGQHGGLDRWFAEKWVDVKTGKACGRQEGEDRAYPACRPSKRISSKTPKTSSEMSSSEKAKFKSTKTSSQRISYNHKRK